MGACLVKVTLSPVNQKIENQGQPFQNQHQFHRMITYVFGRHCFLRICRTDKVKLINNRKSAYKWFFIFAFSVTAAGLVANNWALIQLWDPVLFSSPGTGQCAGTLVLEIFRFTHWVQTVYLGKLIRNWLLFPLQALAYLQIMCSGIHSFEENRPQSEQNVSKSFPLYFEQCKSYVWFLVSVSCLFRCIRSWSPFSKQTRTRPLCSHLFLCSFGFGFRFP